jgi:hypothetical protein
VLMLLGFARWYLTFCTVHSQSGEMLEAPMPELRAAICYCLEIHACPSEFLE